MKNMIQKIFTFLAFGFLCVSLSLVFFKAPIETTMGIVQKIFYIHVPCAYSMYLGWVICAICSVLYLTTHKDNFDMLAKSAAELALLFAIGVMITGPLWGRKSWGAYWTWDPRLTSALLLTLIIFSYVMLRNFAGANVEKRFGAALAILGACVIPIIHISVNQWRGQHPSVIGAKGGGLAPDMKWIFALCMISFTLVFISMLTRRYYIEKRSRTLLRLQEEILEKGLGGSEQQ